MNRKIIITAICGILLSLTLITTATFAIFTSETKNNVTVQAGELEIVSTLSDLKTFSLDVEQAKGTFENGGTAVLDEGTIKLNKVTPGDKVSFKLTVVNKSNIAIKYRVVVSITGELSKTLILKEENDTIASPVWRYLGSDQAGVIEENTYSIEFPKKAGNEYQKKDAEVVIAVYAVQGNTPQEDLEGLCSVNGLTYNDFQEALIAAKKMNETLYVHGNVEALLTTEGVNNLNNIKIEGLDNAKLTLKNENGGTVLVNHSLVNVSFKNITINKESYETNTSDYAYLTISGNCKFENVTFNGSVLQKKGSSKFINCKFVSYSDNNYGVLVNDGTAEFEGCSFTGVRGLNISDILNETDVTKVIVDGCFFELESEKTGIELYNENGLLELVIKNSTFVTNQSNQNEKYMFIDFSSNAGYTYILLENNIIK